MSIQKDIKQQSAFKSPHQKVAVNLLYTASWLTAQQAELLKPSGLSVQQYNVLRILRGAYPQAITVNAIIERMLDRMSNASRLVDKLLAKNLVTRHECPRDRRAVDVCITEEGLSLLAQLDDEQTLWENDLQTLNADEAHHLSDLLDKLRASGG